MLMPLGLLVPLIFKRVRFLRMLLTAVIVSVFIETMQLLGNIIYGSPHRDVNIDDVIFNVSGCIIAYIVFAVFRKLFKPVNRRKNA
jgi:glycopeptide antibiotics resistance protein